MHLPEREEFARQQMQHVEGRALLIPPQVSKKGALEIVASGLGGPVQGRVEKLSRSTVSITDARLGGAAEAAQ